MGKNRKGNKNSTKPGEGSSVDLSTPKQNDSTKKHGSDFNLDTDSVKCAAENSSKSAPNVSSQRKIATSGSSSANNEKTLASMSVKHIRNGGSEAARTLNETQHSSVSGEIKTTPAPYKIQSKLSSASVVKVSKSSSVDQCSKKEAGLEADNVETQKSAHAVHASSCSEASKKSLEEGEPDVSGGTYKNVNASSPVVVVGRDSLKEMLRKMEKIIPLQLRSYPGDPYLPPPPPAELAAKRRRNAGHDNGTNTNNGKSELTGSNSESSNQVSKKKNELKRYPRIGNLMKSAKTEYKNIEAAQHVDKIRFCPSAFESQAPSTYPNQNSRFMSMPTSRYHDYRKVVMRRLHPDVNTDEDTEESASGEKQFVAVSELDADASFAAETMTQAVIEYMRVEQLRVTREFVRCKKQRIKFTKLLDSKNVSGESLSAQPVVANQAPADVSTDEKLGENISPPETKINNAKAELTKIICKFLYNDADCLCQLDIYSWFPKTANGKPKPCVCKRIQRVNKSDGACELNSDSDFEDVDSLAFKVRTACEIFGKKLPEEVVRDEEFNTIAKQVSHSVAIEEYKLEEERIREEKYTKFKNWVSKKAEIEARIERCLTVIKWASCNEEYMMDYATDEDREFLAGVMIQENRLQKSLKELSLDNPNNGPPSCPSSPGHNESSSSSTCAHPSKTIAPDYCQWTEVDLCEISLQTVTSKASLRLKSELSKLVTIFQMKHILLSLNLW